MSDTGYDVFISYSSKEIEFVTRLTGALRSSGCTTFGYLDVLVGEDWRMAKSKALTASRFVLVVLSQAYFASRALESEWRLALRRENEESRVVILPAWFEDCYVPDELSAKVRVDFRGSDEPDIFNARVAELVRAIRRLTSRDPPSPPTGTTGPAPPSALPPVVVPADLIQSCLAGECVLFAGAGLSARAGVPTWNQFLFDLLDHAVKHKVIDSGYAQSLAAALNEGARDAAADGIVQMFGNQRELLQSFLQQYFQDAGPIASAHKLLQQIPFSSVITTNYDRLLERAFAEYAQEGLFTPKEAEPLLDALSQKRRFILKLYGLIERLETLIFAPIEYREALSSNISFSKFMEGIFFSRTFFFVGLGIEGIQDFLSGFVFRGTSPRKHFALVAVTGSAWEAKARFLQSRYNIEVIPFPVSDTFPEVETFLENLCHAVHPVASQEVSPAAQIPVMPGLRRVVLEDIGPFERLDLDFPKQHNWKVLLGDNGVGKSTILKAIAVAIMGNDARSFATRLVRSGKTKGRITLYTEQNPVSGYVTEILTKDMLSEAEILSLPARPMESEGWLALGFSPLRVVTWASSTGPQPIVQKGRPTSEDLLPLVSGESDSRMDRLKQWIVNLDSADKQGRARSLSGHTGRVSSVVFAPDGRTLFSGSIDGTIRFWDCWTGSETRKISAHTGGVNSIALSRDGKVLGSGAYDRSAKTWSTGSGDHIKSFKGSRSQIFSVALGADGATLITASESGSVRIWGPDGSELNKINGAGGAVWCLALSPDGETLASGTYGGTINLNNVEAGGFIRSLEVRGGVVKGLAWSPDGQSLICGSRNGPVTVWDVASGLRIREFPGADTTTVAVSPDGRIIAAGFQSGNVKAWDAESGQGLMNVQAHPQPVRCVALAPDGRTLASASDDQTIKLWSLPGSIPAGNQQETIRRFFRLVGILTDRQDIDYLCVTENYRVMVKIADAAEGVPLELLSQGMTSLFGWIGVLCQRLKETLQLPTQDPLPTNSYALVLIDELDAHMHPRWQQVLVHRLKKAFPNAQFIVCTHSPLIVGGLAMEEVDRFTIKKGKIVKVDFDPDMTLGRTDQILTGELFGLKTTLDAVTQGLVAEYEDLLGEPNRSDEQKKRFKKLGQDLEDRIPPTPSRLVERRAGELLEALQSADGNDKQPRVIDCMSRLAKALRGDA
jgi:WD40 repeat protein